MHFGEVRLLPVLVSAVAFMMIGGLWYGPLFAKAWMQLIGKTEEEIRSTVKATMYIGAFIAAFIASYVLAVIIEATGMIGTHSGAIAGLCTSIGFVATAFASSYLFNRKPLKLWMIDAGYQVVCFAAAGAIIGAWR